MIKHLASKPSPVGLRTRPVLIDSSHVGLLANQMVLFIGQCFAHSKKGYTHVVNFDFIFVSSVDSRIDRMLRRIKQFILLNYRLQTTR